MPRGSASVGRPALVAIWSASRMYGDGLAAFFVDVAMRRQRHPISGPRQRDVEQPALVGVGAFVAGASNIERGSSQSFAREPLGGKRPPVSDGRKTTGHSRPLAPCTVPSATLSRCEVLLTVEVVVAPVCVVDEQQREVAVEPFVPRCPADLLAGFSGSRRDRRVTAS